MFKQMVNSDLKIIILYNLRGWLAPSFAD